MSPALEDNSSFKPGLAEIQALLRFLLMSIPQALFGISFLIQVAN